MDLLDRPARDRECERQLDDHLAGVAFPLQARPEIGLERRRRRNNVATFVVSARTTAVGADVPRIVCPFSTSTALTTTNGWSVGTPGIENLPSGPV